METLRIKPDDVGARTNLGIAMVRQGRRAEGISQFRVVLRVQPDYLPAQQSLQLALI